MRIARLFSCLLIAAPASADNWRMLEGSELLFEPSWEGTPLPGRFDDFEVTLESNDGGVAGAQLTVTVRLSGADMDDPDMNEAIAGPEWFAVAEHPSAIYTSPSIEETGPDRFIAKGVLELKGVRKSVDVPFAWTESGDRAEMNGELTIDRTEFGVGSGEWASDESIGIEVGLTFKIILARQ